MQPRDFEHFARALTEPGAALPAGLRATGGVPIPERFSVYRNNVYSSLIAVLAARFPVCLALVGPEFFQAMARVYVGHGRPSSPLLHEYGSGFPAFLEAFEPAASLTFLPDMARLEGLWIDCWGAAEAPTLSQGDLARMEPEELLGSRLALHPAARLLRSNHPVATLWTLHQAPDPDLSGIQWQAECVLLTRPHADIGLRRINHGVATFAVALADHACIDDAAVAALTDDPDFDLGTALAGLAEDGFITGITP
ncbi:MAG: hypothetical protein RL030_862 [Pseudomonadota bacterium]